MCRDEYDTMVKIVVGETPLTKSFEIHKGVLCHHSDYFRSALNGKFEEAEKAIVRLPSEDVVIFTYFRNWLYTRKLHASTKLDCKAMGNLDIVKLYVFADCRQIPSLANACINLLCEKVIETWRVPTECIAYIYARTLRGSMLRRFVIDVIAATWTSVSEDKLDQEYWDAEPLRDLSKKLLSRPKFHSKPSFSISFGNLCQYHVHPEGIRCD